MIEFETNPLEFNFSNDILGSVEMNKNDKGPKPPRGGSKPIGGGGSGGKDKKITQTGKK